MRLRRVIALAGRRIDPVDATASVFPLAKVGVVRRRLAALLREDVRTVIVSSAACGADLVALDEARKLGIRTRIVLPYGVAAFRATSVVDRPGDWGPLFDEIVARAATSNDLVILQGAVGSTRAFEIATRVILREASAISAQRKVAVLVWSGETRTSGHDLTSTMARYAPLAGFERRYVPI